MDRGRLMYQIKKIVLTVMIMVSVWAGNNVIVSASDQLVDTGLQQITVGWGCPLKEPISNIRSGFGNELLGYINFFLPITEMLSILSGWLVAIMAYYIASVALRWARAIS